MTIIHSVVRGAVAVGLLLLTGCVMPTHGHDDGQWAPTAPVAAAAAPLADGSIYHDQHNMELFSDPRAHRVGDILTVVLQEITQASKNATTTTSKNDSVAMAAPTILGQGVTLHGQPLSTTLGTKNAFAGAGSSTQSNQLSGEITVTVAQRLGNGDLMVRGEKMVTINQGQELVRLSGIVRPQDITPNNTVLSSLVANARIAYTGSGTLADANSQGWLARFFNSKWMPF